MQRKHLFSLLSALVVLPACTPGPQAYGSQPLGQPVAVAPAQVSTPNAAALTLSGTVMGPEAPLVNAPVTAYFMGEPTAIVTTRTDMNGAFTLVFPASAADRLINVVATQGNVTLVATTSLDSAEANAYQVFATRAALAVSPGSTLLSLALGDRLNALAATRPSARAVREAIATLKAATSSAVAAIKALSPTQLQAFLSVAGPLGLGTIPPAIASAVTAAGMSFRAAFEEAATEISQAIATRIQEGASLPTSFNPAPGTFGTVTTPGIPGAPAPGTSTGNPPGSASGSGGSSGGGSGGNSADDGVSAAISVGTPTAAGGYTAPGAATTGQVAFASSGTILAQYAINNMYGLPSDIEVAADGTVWLVSGASLVRVNGTTGVQRPLLPLRSETVGVKLTQNGLAWISEYRGSIARIDPNITNNYYEFHPRTDPPITDIALSPNGVAVWYGVDSSPGVSSMYRDSTDVPGQASITELYGVPRSFVFAPDNTAWVIEDPAADPVVHTDAPPELVHRALDGSEIAGDGVTLPSGTHALHLGPDGTLWLTTTGGELLRRAPGQPPVLLAQPAATNSRNGLAVVQDGSVWYIQSPSTLVHLSATGAFIASQDVAFEPSCLAVAPDGTLWIAGDGNLTRMTP